MKLNSILILLFIFSISKAQNIHNQVLGKYASKDNKGLYSNFTFYNNGKVLISDISEGDYFVKNDTLIIFPDKSMFKFIIKNNELIGVSDWVSNGKWTLNKEKVTDKRKDNSLANNNALLLNEYYEKTRMKDNQIDILFDENLKNEYLKTIENLCDKGLVRACKEVFGMETLSQMGGIEKVLTNEKSKEITENPKLLKIANNVIKIEPSEGYNLLFLYYTMTNQTDKANEASEKAMSLGNKDVVMTKMTMDLEEIVEKTTTNSDVDPIYISTLRMFNKQKFTEIEEFIKSKYGFKLIDKTISDDVEIRDYENKSFNRITKFQYKNSQNNRIEYTTKNKEELIEFKQDLKNYQKVETIDSKTGEIREDYKQQIKLGKGYIENYYVQILYPPTNKPNESITILLFE